MQKTRFFLLVFNHSSLLVSLYLIVFIVTSFANISIPRFSGGKSTEVFLYSLTPYIFNEKQKMFWLQHQYFFHLLNVLFHYKLNLVWKQSQQVHYISNFLQPWRNRCFGMIPRVWKLMEYSLLLYLILLLTSSTSNLIWNDFFCSINSSHFSIVLGTCQYLGL